MSSRVRGLQVFCLFEEAPVRGGFVPAGLADTLEASRSVANVPQRMLREHSTLSGIAGTTLLILVVGEFSHWSAALMIVMGILGMLILPRAFYGFTAARALDKEQGTAQAGIGFRHHMWDPTPTEEERLENAIDAAEGFGNETVGPSASALERLAREEPACRP